MADHSLFVFLLLLIGLDQFFGHALRHLLVGGKFHGELGLALGQGTQARRVAEHLGQRHLGLDHGIIALFKGTDNNTAPLVDAAHDRALELGRPFDGHLHDRLHDNRRRPCCTPP